jgi:hypothetical protein
MNSSVSVSVTAYTTANTITYVSSKMLLLFKEIIREIGLDPGKLIDEWNVLERGISTWLLSKHLERIRLEIYDPATDKLVCPWDLDVVYGYGGDGSFWVDVESIRYSIKKAGLVPSSCRYNFMVFTSAGRPDVAGWSTGTARSTEGFTRYGIGATVGGNGIGTEVYYWKKI